MTRLIVAAAGTLLLNIASAAEIRSSQIPPPKTAADDPGMFDDPEANAYVNTRTDREDRVMIPLRDGIHLSATLYFPKDRPRKDLPTILMFTPYNAAMYIPYFGPYIPSFLHNGYLVALVSERGHYGSEGVYTYMGGAGLDGYDTIDWLSKQPWSNRKVGLFGHSGSAEEQNKMNMMHHPALKAIVPICSGAGIGRVGPYVEWGNFYRGGVVNNLWYEWYSWRGYKYKPSFPATLSREQLLRAAKHWPEDPVWPDVEETLARALQTLPPNQIMEKMDSFPTDLDDYINRLPNDPRWKESDFGSEGGQWGAPALVFNNWYDISIGPNVAMYAYQAKNAAGELARNNIFMVVGPRDHALPGTEREHTIVGERDLGDARYDALGLIQRWFDHWLKGVENAVTKMPKVKLYTMGINQWQTFPSWPVPNTKTVKMFLSGSNAAGLEGDGKLVFGNPTQGSDRYVYDPLNPTPTLGGAVYGVPGMTAGAFDQRKVEQRPDVLNYTSDALTKPLQVTGPIGVTLYLSSDVKDTDLMVTLSDVLPDGRAYNLDMGIMRVRWRNGFDGAPTFMEPNGVYRVAIPPLVTSNVFLPGHRIRISIASSNFPQFERNMNTGGNNFDEDRPIVAHNAIHHGGADASEIELPVLYGR
jgi:hypothetical protein